ncbi:MAG: nicotinate-nucleotide adenylyltransferase [Bacteroidetes bacterium]|nr:nicotinate-nucleotide adenylyltransferase [Bacteroidota bacterium]
MAKIGLYFGSFNPIHIGHLIIADYMMQFAGFDKIRFVVSPQNPFKQEGELMPENLRLQMVKLAIDNNPNFEVSDIEFQLPKPSYTIQTIREFLKTENHSFSLIMGSDNLEKLPEWKEVETLLEQCEVHLYNRRGSEKYKTDLPGKFIYHEAPFLNISATYIRELLDQNKIPRYLVPEKVLDLLMK